MPHRAPESRAPTDARVGVISNPYSGRNRKLLGSIDAMLRQHACVTHVVTDSADALPRAMEQFAATGVNIVAINGGDGSVACALEHLDCFGDNPPLMIALPGGTTNVTVNDVGIKGALDTAVQTMLRWLTRGHPNALVVERDILAVQDAHGRSGGAGLVFGAGAVVHGIEYWNEQVRARGMRSEFSSGVAMVRTVFGMLRADERFAPPLHARVHDVESGKRFEADLMLFVACTLRRLFLGITPFWGHQLAPLEVTAIERGVRGFLRNLPSILRGQQTRTTFPEFGYHSFNSHRIELDFEGAYTLDGEVHRVAAGDAPLTLFSPGSVKFLRIHP